MERIQGNIKRKKRQRQPEEEEGRNCKALGEDMGTLMSPMGDSIMPHGCRMPSTWQCRQKVASSCGDSKSPQKGPSYSHAWHRSNREMLPAEGLWEPCLGVTVLDQRAGPFPGSCVSLRKRRLFPNQRTQKEFPVWWRSVQVTFGLAKKVKLTFIIFCCVDI